MTQRFNNKLAALIVLGSVFWLATAQASIIYVDKDSSCPGSGTSNSPYCTIQRAFDVVRAGDTVRIRSSATPYTERALATRSGTSKAPITVEPDVGHKPILRFAQANAQQGAVEVRDADYWRIRGLTFDGSGTQTSRHAILLYAYNRDITGHQIAQNTFRRWGGTGENTKGASAVALRPRYGSSVRVKNSLVSDNNFSQVAHEAIRLIQTMNVTVESNTIVSMLCGRTPDGRAGASGIKDSQDSVGSVIRNNIVHDHQRSEDCLLPKQGSATYAGIYCDTGPTHGEIIGNTVYNIDKDHPDNTNPRATGLTSVGIFIESRCHDWRVHGNVVYNIGAHGLRNGSNGTGDPNRTEWTNNTVYGVSRIALLIPRGRNLTVKNNILIHDQAHAGIEIKQTAVEQGPHSIDHNLYWDMQDGAKVGRWGEYRTLNLANWRKSCKCDSAGLSTNPLFVSTAAGFEDLRLKSSSDALGAGEGDMDLGAYSSAP